MLEILEYRVLATVAEGGNPGAASSMLKVLATELSQGLTELALEAAGPRGRAYQPHATLRAGRWPSSSRRADGYISGERWQAVAPLHYFNDRAGSIYARQQRDSAKHPRESGVGALMDFKLSNEQELLARRAEQVPVYPVRP